MTGPKSLDVCGGGLRDAFLREGVYFASVGADIVVLDRTTDAYSCLPDAAETVRVAGDRISAPADWIDALTAAGLAKDGPTPGRAPLPSHPMVVLSSDAPRVRLRDVGALALAAVAGWRHGPAAPVDALVRTLPKAPAQAPDLARVSAVVTAFQAVSPWLPRQGACLFRASVLLRALRHAGENATWVFGVRTWPFSAHCWLQIADCVLDDDPERVALYTPIMAV